MASLLYLAIFLLIYFVPSLHALKQEHRQLKAIFILNLFLGWTVIGWVGALVWASIVPADNQITKDIRT